MNEPVFKHYEESTNLQLFFDLFFVANLASFNDKQEINSQVCKSIHHLLLRGGY